MNTNTSQTLAPATVDLGLEAMPDTLDMLFGLALLAGAGYYLYRKLFRKKGCSCDQAECPVKQCDK